MCVGVCRSLPLCFTARMCIHRLLNALVVAPVPPRSLRSVGNAQGSRCRARILRGAFVEKSPPGISLCDSSAGRSHLLSLVLFLDYFQKKKLGGGCLDRGGKNLVPECLQLAPLSAAQRHRQHKSIYFTHFFKNHNASKCSLSMFSFDVFFLKQ